MRDASLLVLNIDIVNRKKEVWKVHMGCYTEDTNWRNKQYESH